MTKKTKPATSALKVLKTLDAMAHRFAMGVTPKDLIEATGFDGATIRIHLVTLMEAGYVEQIIETERYRPSIRFARVATFVLRELDNAANKIEETRLRINTGL